MRFIVDAQLPLQLCEILQTTGLNAVHVDSLPNGDQTSDKDISTYADQNNLIVITKDSDFYHSQMILGKPKKLLLVTTGNIKNRALFDIFRANALMVKKMFETCNYIEMTNHSIIGHDL